MVELPLHIIMVSSAILPNQLAHPIQILKTAHALARQPGVRVTLHCITLRRSPRRIMELYGLEPLETLRLRPLLPHWWVSLAGMTTHIDPQRRPIYRLIRTRLRRQWRGLEEGGERVVLYTRNENVLAWLGPAARVDGVPFIMELHWLKYVDRYRKWRAKREARGERIGVKECKSAVRRFNAREKADLELATRILPITRALGDKVQRLGVVRPMDWLPSGVELPRLALQHEPAIDILYSGQLYAWKGPDLLIEAMRFLKEYRLTVVGGNNRHDLERLRTTAEGRGVADRVDFMGHRPHREVAGYIARAKVCVIPLPARGVREARSFTSPMKLFEFAAQGRAIVASDLPSLREVLTHGENAWLVRPDDPQALADGIRTLLGDASLRERLGGAARRLAESHTFAQRAHRIIEAIRAES